MKVCWKSSGVKLRSRQLKWDCLAGWPDSRAVYCMMNVCTSQGLCAG